MLSSGLPDKKNDANENKNVIDYSKLDLDALKKMAGGLFSKGDPNAQYEIGKRMPVYAGHLMEANKARYEWFKKAADQKHVGAMYEIARYFHCKSMGCGNNSSDEKKYRDSYSLWLGKSAENGNPKAQLELGVDCARGNPSPDIHKALYWIQRSAAQDNMKALALLAEIYAGLSNGHKAIKCDKYINYKEAFNIAEKLSHKNNPHKVRYHGSVLQGFLYYTGYGVQRDITLAMHFYLLARTICPEKDKIAQLDNNLGFIFGHDFIQHPNSNGFHFEREAKKSMRSQFDLRQEVQNSAEKDELDRLSNMMRENDRNGLGCYYLSIYEQKEENKNNPGAKAIEFLTQIASTNKVSGETLYQLYRCYKLGLAGVKPDSNAASHLIRQAVLSGHVEANFELGNLYTTGYGKFNVNLKAAEKHYLFAEAKGHKGAGLALNALVANENLDKSAYKADIIQRGISRNNPIAQVKMGLQCLEEKKDLEALAWFQQSAAQGNSEGEYYLGYCYENGIGVPQALRSAAEYYQQSATKGNANAKSALLRPEFKDKAYEAKIAHDEAGENELSILITKNELVQLSQRMSKLETEALEAEEKNDILQHVQAPIRKNVIKIVAAAKKAASRYRELAEPIVSDLIQIIMQEMEMINKCDSAKNALDTFAKRTQDSLDYKEHKIAQQDLQSATQDLRVAMNACNEILVLREAYKKINYDLQPCIKSLENCLVKLKEQISAINQAHSPKAYEFYMSLHCILKLIVDSCSQYQVLINGWQVTEVNIINRAKRKYVLATKILDNEIQKAKEEVGKARQEIQALEERRELLTEKIQSNAQKLDEIMVGMYLKYAQNTEIPIVTIGGFQLSVPHAVIGHRLAEHFKGKISNGEIPVEKIREEERKVISDYFYQNIPSENIKKAAAEQLVDTLYAQMSNLERKQPGYAEKAKLLALASRAISSSGAHSLYGGSSPAFLGNNSQALQNQRQAAAQEQPPINVKSAASQAQYK